MVSSDCYLEYEVKANKKMYPRCKERQTVQCGFLTGRGSAMELKAN